ncbi:PAS domain S-box protein [Variovorax sp. J31P179]|uniref:PAS domain-containing sensor histidine kinase n=1 Tax=Variovorax sp. J31P179 TaxID=3053508 RepID=UPI0025779298|nr:PAS domain S-box protein [Variovorax sp. J31P179]MDM0085472.1 PAS domain S-box protein [Variovorax sp. J31P179]
MTNFVGPLPIVVAVQAAVMFALWIRGQRRSRAERVVRESEERFHRMIDRAPVMIWTARPDTTLDYLNYQCVEFTGLPIEKLLDEGWLDAVHPEDRDDCIAIYGPAIEARRPFLFEYRVRRADGAYRWLLATGVPRYGPDGIFVGFVGCDVDITERREAEDLTEKSRVAVEASNREIQHLAGQLLTAHEDERKRLARELHDDLTQRLARLAIDAGRMEGAADAPEGLRPLREELVRLSEDVHALSYRLHPSVLDDLGLVEALRAECDRVAQSGQLRVNVQAEAVPAAFPVQASLCLYRVVQEALSNAVRHGRGSAVNVLLSPRAGGLQVEVRDNGSGFDPERSRDHASLGLASMRERVRLLQGEFNIDSAPGRGTTIVAWVPS